AAHHLLRRLMEAEAEGAIAGEVVVAPFANPIGLDQQVNSYHLGRHELGGGGNFNRNWPDLAPAAAEKIAGKLTESEDANVATVRAALLEAVAEMTPLTQLDSLRQVLAGQAVDADLVFDLHCDDDALMHLFVIPQHWPLAAGIAAELGCHAVMLSEDSGGSSFDEAFSVPWVKLAALYPDHPIPAACLASTVEFRGQRDVSDKLAERDAGALFRSLQRHGVIAGDPGPLPEALCEATPLSGCEFVKAPAPGVLGYEVELGDRVEKGQVIAWLIDPAAEDPNAGRRAIHAGTAGRILSRRDRLYVQPGETLAKVVGSTPLAAPRAKNLLGD
ncbi:MAG: succinylglutamate desuccinylase/aspartoacylase family protein, partial [Alphaproteobacteria bacterium]